MNNSQMKHITKGEICGIKFKRRPVATNIVITASNLKDLNVDVQALVTKLVTMQLKKEEIV
ncbi:hypothetical protein [Marinisporobacter balticus]|uniref:Uncharacterized protein n=1 Tax=Marinisporobacter balticus TaxID=2018667 RepID=A0A4R2KZE6_9FIRM|nr:hypothetical protein [Marinisporobacter balticus]TCO79303.1 hypothetical protein EV214_10221 [Marinisporobacter balticus]